MMKTREQEHPLRAYRRRKKISQKTLADRAGTTKGHISQIETGVVEPGLDMLRRVIRAADFEVSCDDVLWWGPLGANKNRTNTFPLSVRYPGR